MRINSKSVFASRGVCGVQGLSRWLAAAVALLVVLVMGVPAAWGAAEADSQVGPTVALHADTKTEINLDGDAATYKLGKATVTGGNSSYIVVQVDSGYFTPADSAPVGASAADALDKDSKFVEGTAVAANQQYAYVAFKSSDGKASVTAQAIEDYLHNLTFTLDGDQSQSVSVTAINKSLKATSDAGTEYDVVLFNGNAYTLISEKKTWSDAYAAAKKLTFSGAQGHLLTIESEAEHNLIYRSFSGSDKRGWLGATRFTTAEQAGENKDTFTPATDGDNWYWVTGPSAGTKLWNGKTSADGSAVDGVYHNWNSGEPNASENHEGYAQYGHGTYGQWNDLSLDGGGSFNHIAGFYVEFEKSEGLDLGNCGEVSPSVKRIEVTCDRDGGKMSSSSVSKSAARSVKAVAADAGIATVADDGADDVSSEYLLTNMAYSTTLSAAEGRQLDTDTVAVKVGGKTLQQGEGYTFDESTGKLSIPAKSVTASVSIEAKVKRQVTITDDKNKALSSKTVSYGATLDKSDVDKVTKKSGYTVSSYTNKTDDSSFSFASKVTEDMTLAAQYQLNDPTVTVTPDKTKLETRDDTAKVSVSTVKPDAAEVTETISWTKDGETVSSCANATVCEISDAGSYTVTVTEDDGNGHTSSVFKTVSIAAPTVHTVTVKSSDTSSNTVSVTNGDALGADNVPDSVTKQGYTFSGWQTSDGTLFDPASTPVTSSLTVSPMWTLDKPEVSVTASPAKLESVGDKTTIATTVTVPSVEGGQVTTDYKWYKDGTLIEGVTSANYETTDYGTYTVEVTATDSATGKSSTTVKEITVAAPDARTITIIGSDGSTITVEVPNGGTVDPAKLPQLKKDGYELSGWKKADGTLFDPSKDTLTDDMTIYPVWKLLEPNVETTVSNGTIQVKVDNPAGAKIEYQWFKDGKLLAGQTGASLVDAQPGVYIVRITLTDTDGNTVTVERTVTVDAANSAATLASRSTLASTGSVLLPAAFALAAMLLAAVALLALACRLS